MAWPRPADAEPCGFPHAAAVHGRKSALASARGRTIGGGHARRPMRWRRRPRGAGAGAALLALLALALLLGAALAAGRRRARPGGGRARRPRRRRRCRSPRASLRGGDREAAAGPDGAGARPRGHRAARGAGAGAAAQARLDAKLADIAAEADSAVHLSSSTATASRSPPATPARRGSFVGSDYGFRTYFTRAMAEGTAQQYALGTVSGRPGLYLSRRVDSVLGPLGVVVVKVEFDELEARWRESGLVVQVTDARRRGAGDDRARLAVRHDRGRSPTRRRRARRCSSATARWRAVPVAVEGDGGARGSTGAPLRRAPARGRAVGAGLAADGCSCRPSRRWRRRRAARR